ncbi:MAG: circularly permuted type 2 ATP-grasp protein [Rhodospirillaceae bacterium]|nr:circularly permuted type 2 ATP-grasp protein [Rhodospirillales bacterium]
MAFDEMKSPDGAVRAPYRAYENWLLSVAPDLLPRKHEQADELFRRIGITFNVYGDQEGTERLIPFDPIPRVLTAKEWTRIHDGCIQRVKALNAFIHDIYHDQNILKAGIIPAEQVLGNGSYRPEMHGLDVARNVYVQIAGVDVVRTGTDEFYVLEDNLRTPSGVSYMLEDRAMMMRLFPQLFARHRVKPVDHYPDMLLKALRSVAPVHCDGEPNVVVLTPGYHNSAYFEHAFLAEQMGVDLVEGRDLFVSEGLVWMRTTRGPRRVDVIYRRIDDDFLDPLAFRADSTLGVAGLLSIYRQGGVTLANAIGTGVADDKSTYIHVPDMIKFYLDEEPLLPNVPTWRLEREDERKYVLERLGELVVKEVHGSGGYGMLVGPTSTKAQIEEFRAKILTNPSNYIAQPTLALSTCPTLVDKGIVPRHVDLRPFVLSGETTTVVPGGLTRVAIKEGSLVVNSSQGGGTKDTWVLEEDEC